MNSAQLTLAYTPPTIKNEQELIDYCNSGVFEVLNEKNEDACARTKDATLNNASITIVQGKELPPIEDKDSTIQPVELVAVVIVMGLAMKYRRRIRSILTRIQQGPQHGEAYYGKYGYASEGSEIPINWYEKPDDGELDAMMQSGIKGSMEELFESKLYDASQKPSLINNELDVIFVFSGKSEGVVITLLDSLTTAIAKKSKEGVNKDIILERTLGLLGHLRYPQTQESIDSARVSDSIKTKLRALYGILISVTTTQSPAAPVTPDTDSSD